MTSIATLTRGLNDGRVHRSVYTDPEIFALEMERIYGRAWVYLGHESQIRAPGDFFTTRIGRHRLLVTRHTDGQVHALHNRCTHRGAELCPEADGHAPRFVCPYHAWTFNGAGDLVGVPHASGYDGDFKSRRASLGLERVARVDSYRGFIFGSLAASGPSLPDFLGPVVCEAFDNFVDRSPSGELEIAGGKLVQTFRANWKLQIENSIDLVHPPVLHHNAIKVSEAFLRDAERGRPVPPAIDVFRSNGLPFAEWDEVTIVALEHGHCYMQGFLQKGPDGEIPEDERFGSDDQMRFPTQAEYKAALVARHGAEKTERILAFNRHNTIVYPNLFINPRLQQVRVLHPTAVDRTEQHCYVFRLLGAPPEALQVAVSFLNASNSPASIVTTDDHEVFERIQDGLSSGAAEWVDLTRSLGRDVVDADGIRGVGTSELAMRNQHAAWRRYMEVSA